MEDHQDKLLHRLKIIRGHLEKVIKMVESDAYCMDIMQQTTAVGAALKEVENMILENHLRTCVTEAVVNRRDVAKKVDEVIKVFRVRK